MGRAASEDPAPLSIVYAKGHALASSRRVSGARADFAPPSRILRSDRNVPGDSPRAWPFDPYCSRIPGPP
jgi:hypothetical protein